jgi:hypothetical protein
MPPLPPRSVTVYVVPSLNAEDGVSTTDWFDELYVTVEGMVVVPARNVTFVPVTEAPDSASLNTAVTSVLVATPVAPVRGVVEDTCGAVRSVTNGLRAKSTPPFRTDVEMVTVPFPVLPAVVRIAHAPPTDTLFVVSWTSKSSVIAPGAFDDRQVASLQVILLPPAEPTA